MAANRRRRPTPPPPPPPRASQVRPASRPPARGEQVFLIRTEREEFEIGRGQIREFSANIGRDLDVTAFGDAGRLILPSSRTTITITLEVERVPG